MLIQSFVDEGLGNSSYLLASKASGLAAVVDPEHVSYTVNAPKQTSPAERPAPTCSAAT